MITIFIFLTILIDTKLIWSVKDDLFENYKNHPCIRNCSASTSPMICKYEWNIEWYATLSKACYYCPFNQNDCERKDCIAANGIERALMSVNRMLPGPAIHVCENDQIIVNVFNNLKIGETTSIHWHGQTQKNTPFMDGVPMITQCPILPHTYFQYNFKASTPGTHFWHSHSGIQRSDGIFGAFVVREKALNNKYDEDLIEHTIIFNDWYDETIATKFNLYVHKNKSANNPNAILINGKGSKKIYENNFRTSREIFKVEKGKRYRFRLISAGITACPIEFSIENHLFSIIAADGDPVKVIENLESLMLYAGERYDIVVKANQKSGNYIIRAKGFGVCNYAGLVETAILNYNGVELPKTEFSDIKHSSILINGLQFNNFEVKNPDFKNKKHVTVNDLKGVKNNEFLKKIRKKPTKQFFFELEYKMLNHPEFNNKNNYPVHTAKLDAQLYIPQINNISLYMPDKNLLSQWNEFNKEKLCNDLNKEKICANQEVCSCTHLIEIGLNENVEIILVDASYTKLPITLENKHPMHLHGAKFALVAMNEINSNQTVTIDYIKDLDSKGLINRNLYDPPLKDTLPLPHGGFAVIRFIADNPGIWLFHCHVELHSEVGMTVILKVGDISEFPKIPKGWPKCGSYIYSDMN